MNDLSQQHNKHNTLTRLANRIEEHQGYIKPIQQSFNIPTSEALEFALTDWADPPFATRFQIRRYTHMPQLFEVCEINRPG